MELRSDGAAHFKGLLFEFLVYLAGPERPHAVISYPDDGKLTEKPRMP